ncbi:hypothetical protein DFH06DRAFT_1330496 [Mycena polygramma]|nr:hypothetical protein DFH06DRAFT_1330496 [Mycena polygramma]
MCTHLPQPGYIVDPIETIRLKSPPPKAQSYVCTPSTPYRFVPQLPQEIIDAIVDNIEDLASFKACSLVCWAFVPASRIHIFRDISLDMVNDMPHKLHAMLLRSPQIALYVRDLTIYRSHDPKLWMLPGSPLPAVLSMLPHIKRFSIFACWGEWMDAPAPLRAAILRVVTRGTLDRLHVLTAFNLPAAFLRGAMSVRVLSLYHCSLNPSDNPRLLRLPPTGPVTAPEYLNLSLDTKVGKMLDQLLGSAYLSNVRRLAVNPIPNSTNSPPIFAKALGAVETSLERLDIQWHECHFQQFYESRFDMSRLTRMRTLQLHIIMEQSDTLIPAYLPLAIADTRRANPHITHLTFVLHLPAIAGSTIPAPSALACARALHLLDAEFSATDKPGFEDLAEVHWRITPECSPPQLVPDYVPFFEAHLPRTGARGILSVEQGFRMWGDAIMPLLPYTSVWPHRSKN